MIVHQYDAMAESPITRSIQQTWRGTLGLEKSRTGVTAEEFGFADISTQRLDTTVARDVHHFENRSSFLGGGGQESSPQAMPAEQ
jgi:hypothetical protein